MLNTPVCCLVWVNHQLPAHQQECLLEAGAVAPSSAEHSSHPLPLGRPRTSLDLSGLGPDIGAAQSTMEPESLTAATAAVVQGMGQDVPTTSLNFPIVVGQRSLASLPVLPLVALKRDNQSALLPSPAE